MTGKSARPAPWKRTLGSAAALVCALAAACGPSAPQTYGYKPGVTLGMTEAQVDDVLGKPANAAPFSLVKINAYVMTYPFGQVLLEDGKAVAITVAQDPTYVGPLGLTLGETQEQVKAAFHAHRKHRVGHLDQYDLVVGQNQTRTRDLYDQTDSLMIEMAAANPNDSLSEFNVISITEADPAGMKLLAAITQAKVGGLYPDQHVFNFGSTYWQT